jgi:outer membrane PBP1 activator LpoA protein
MNCFERGWEVEKMTRNAEEILNAAIALPPAIRAALFDRLRASLEPAQQNPASTAESGLELALDSELERRLLREATQEGLSLEQYAIRVIETHIQALQERRKKTMELLRACNEEYGEEEQKETWDYLVSALDEDRTSDRKLFPPELKGVSW